MLFINITFSIKSLAPLITLTWSPLPTHLLICKMHRSPQPYHLEHWLLFLVVMPCKYSILFWVLFYLHFYFPQNRHNSANYHACDHCDAGIRLSHAFIPLTVICVRRRKARYVQPTNHLFTRLHAPGNIYFQTSKRFDKKYFTTKLINEPTKTWNNSSKQNEVMDITRGKIVLVILGRRKKTSFTYASLHWTTEILAL